MRVLALWRSLAEAGQFPRKSQIDPRLFGADWRHCFLVDLDPSVERSRFAYVGAMLEDPGWPTFERQALDDCLEGTLLSTACARLRLMLEKRAPISFSGSASHFGSATLFRAVLLPLESQDGSIDGMLGAVNHREIVGDVLLHHCLPASRDTLTS